MLNCGHTLLMPIVTVFDIRSHYRHDGGVVIVMVLTGWWECDANRE